MSLTLYNILKQILNKNQSENQQIMIVYYSKIFETPQKKRDNYITHYSKINFIISEHFCGFFLMHNFSCTLY